MVTVSELLSHPVFDEFRLVTDRSGLNNRVRDTGIFEWQSGRSLEESFHPGDFVITSLAQYRDLPDSLAPVMFALLNKKLAALCIKDLYFHELPQEITDFANEQHTPIFFFKDSPFDEIIYTIKNSLTPGIINVTTTRNARRILYDGLDSMSIEMLAKEINPYFHNNLICACWMPRNKANEDRLLADFFESYYRDASTIDLPMQSAYSIMRFTHGIVAIYTDSRDEANAETGFRMLSNILGIDLYQFALGLSNTHTSLTEVGAAMREAIYSAVVGAIDENDETLFKDIGFAQVICPLRDNFWMKQYFGTLLSKLYRYDEVHNSNLFGTIETYAHCGGDIKKTAEITFQHTNTIRYRLNKAYEVMGLDNRATRQSQLFLLIRMYDITNRMEGLRI
ncbi:MAG: PucR family transcriptional regulator [Anaerovoracaceae bacterium]|jgi:hypothetical protein